MSMDEFGILDDKTEFPIVEEEITETPYQRTQRRKKEETDGYRDSDKIWERGANGERKK